jgi:hypothetical protein
VVTLYAAGDAYGANAKKLDQAKADTAGNFTIKFSQPQTVTVFIWPPTAATPVMAPTERSACSAWQDSQTRCRDRL